VQRLFVDTSAWLAYVNRTDRAHKRVAKALRKFDGRLVTTNFVFDEAVTVCRIRLNHPTALLMGDLLRDPEVVDLVRVEEADERAGWELFGQREDKSYRFTGCTSFAVMRRLGLEQAAALDADFAREGFAVLP
jgi:predicted nucleic acid-binding protein